MTEEKPKSKKLSKAQKTFIEMGAEVAKCRMDVFTEAIALMKLGGPGTVDMAAIDASIDKLGKLSMRYGSKKELFSAQWDADGKPKPKAEVEVVS